MHVASVTELDRAGNATAIVVPLYNDPLWIGKKGCSRKRGAAWTSFMMHRESFCTVISIGENSSFRATCFALK